MPLAHVRQEANGSWTIHHLEQHLLATAALAQQFAAQFHSGEWGELAGRWHDLGKYRPAFQRHICTSSGYDPNYRISAQANRNTRHASTGAVQAQVAMERLKAAPHGRILAYLIAGHHAGLPDCDAAEQARGQPLNDVLQDGDLLAEALQQAIPAAILSAKLPTTKALANSPKDYHLWIRMLFSSLVDADRLDTEAFGSPDKAQLRSAADHPDMATLLTSFNAHMQELQRQAQPDSTMNQARSAVLARARSQAQQPPGIYTMTVPTGGGKTLSSLAFALEHAVAHGKRRIIYAIPYSSIIDQTAKTFRAVFEQHPEVVLEHHSSAELAASREGESSESKKYAESLQLATENWDVPIIVTTTVQLFESLFAAKPSRCRKLHNLVNSVIVLDETQLLPPNNLQPIRHVIELLQKHYGVSFLLTTATPVPAAGVRDALSLKLLQDLPSQEIIEHPERNYQSLQRANYQLPTDWHQQQSWEQIAQQILAHDQVLAIVNKRQDARDLFFALGADSAEHFHLSALMCPKHRLRVIGIIKQRLRAGLPTRVISTQLVEAGVDLDFPIVYRALAGLDSIIQAGGRCNREGQRAQLGEVIVFVPPSDPPPGLLSQATQVTTSLLKRHPDDAIENPELVSQYFHRLLSEIGRESNNFDAGGVLPLLHQDAAKLNIHFRSAAEKFQMIEEGQSFGVFVNYYTNDEERKEIEQLLAMLAAERTERWLLRKLQPYAVNLYHYQRGSLLAEGTIQETASGYYCIGPSGVYNDKLGLTLPNDNERKLGQSGVVL